MLWRIIAIAVFAASNCNAQDHLSVRFRRLGLGQWLSKDGPSCIRLDCEVIGTRPWTITYTVNGRLNADQGDNSITGLRGGSLRICNVDPERHQGTYRCDVRKGSFSAYKVITVTRSQLQQYVDECYSSPCLNGGRCVDGDNRYRCVCPARFTGDRCQRALERIVTQRSSGTTLSIRSFTMETQQGCLYLNCMPSPSSATVEISLQSRRTAASVLVICDFNLMQDTGLATCTARNTTRHSVSQSMCVGLSNPAVEQVFTASSSRQQQEGIQLARTEWNCLALSCIVARGTPSDRIDITRGNVNLHPFVNPSQPRYRPLGNGTVLICDVDYVQDSGNYACTTVYRTYYNRKTFGRTVTPQDLRTMMTTETPQMMKASAEIEDLKCRLSQAGVTRGQLQARLFEMEKKGTDVPLCISDTSTIQSLRQQMSGLQSEVDELRGYKRALDGVRNLVKPCT